MQRQNTRPIDEIWQYISSVKTQGYILEVMEQMIEDNEIVEDDELGLSLSEEAGFERQVDLV